jgi:hypothetical protein
MPDSLQRYRGSRTHWARAPRAFHALGIVLSAAACGASSAPSTDDDDGGASPGDTSDSPSPGAPGTNPTGALVTVAVDGPGRVTSTPAGIDCGGGATACAARFAGGSLVLTTDDATTVRWDGACSGNGACAVMLGADAVPRSIAARTFAPVRRTFDGADHGSDACYAIAAGPGDSIVVAGEVQRFAQGHDAWAGAFDAAGALAWSYELSTPSEGQDRATGVVALPDGSALVAGTWYSGSDTRWNSFALDLTTAGAPAWSRVNEIAGDDRYTAIARDAAGRLFVAGARVGDAGQMQSWLRALASDGRTELWAVARHGSAPGPDAATGIAVDSTGDVVAVGNETNTASGPDGWIARYAADGTPRWSIALGGAPAGPSTGTDWATGVATGPDDSIAVVGGIDGASVLRVYTAAGEPRWGATATGGESWNGVAVDPAGNTVVAGSLGDALVVRKYAPDGALIWQRKLAGARGQAAAIDGHGNVLVCGAATVAGNSDGAVFVFVQ